MSKSLVADAIADAKEFKKLAIENARLTLAESVTPQIAALLAAKLNEEAGEEDEDEAPKEDEPKVENAEFDALMEKMKELDPEKYEAMSAALAEKKAPVEKEEAPEEGDKEAEPAEESLDIDAALSEIERGQVAETDDKDADDAEKPAEEAPEEDELGEDYIDRILAEVEDSLGDEPEAELDETKDKDADDAKEEAPELEEADANQGLLSIAAELLKKIVPSIDVNKVKEFEKGLKQAMDNSAGGALGVKEAEKPAEEAPKEEEEATTEQMLELKDQLLEMNLLNAKLVYQNKLLISENFSDEQKARIIIAFDKVKTVNEAKLIFETLDVKAKTKTTARPIAESLGFKRIGAPAVVINEAKSSYDQNDPIVQKMMQRAGILKS